MFGGIIGWIIIGGIAGWIASKIMKTDAQQGIILNVVVGIVGGLIGGFILSAITPIDGMGGSFWLSLITCIVGAVVLLFLVKLVTGRSRV